jgi:hypothetical protein
MTASSDSRCVTAFPRTTEFSVGGADLVPLTHLEELLGIRMRRQRDLPSSGLMESLTPGWTERGEAQDDKIEESFMVTRLGKRSATLTRH